MMGFRVIIEMIYNSLLPQANLPDISSFKHAQNPKKYAPFLIS